MVLQKARGQRRDHIDVAHDTASAGVGRISRLRTHTSVPIERIPLALTVGRELRKRWSAQRLPAFMIADKWLMACGHP
jgi:hypothetical protein